MVSRSFAIVWTASAALLLVPTPGVQATEAGRLSVAVPKSKEVLTQAEQRYAEADFEGALQALDRATELLLSRDDLLRTYSLRALIHYALGEEAAMREALRVLALLSPSHELGPSAPPAVRLAWEDVRQTIQAPLSLHVQVEMQAHGVRISATSGGDAGDSVDIVRSVRVSARVNEGPWVHEEGQAIQLPTADGDLVEYYATVLGPGGSVLLERGTAQAPLRWRLSEPNRAAPWFWGVVGMGVGAVGTAFVVWLVDGNGERSTVLSETQLGW
jgi:hypothetical protein